MHDQIISESAVCIREGSCHTASAPVRAYYTRAAGHAQELRARVGHYTRLCCTLTLSIERLSLCERACRGGAFSGKILCCVRRDRRQKESVAGRAGASCIARARCRSRGEAIEPKPAICGRFRGHRGMHTVALLAPRPRIPRQTCVVTRNSGAGSRMQPIQGETHSLSLLCSTSSFVGCIKQLGLLSCSTITF